MRKLHDLIHGLTQGEKRYVKIRLKANKASSLLNTYFDFISKKRNYSFEKVREIGGQSTKLTQSNLSLLFEVVLKHLQGHYSAKNSEYRLRGDLSNVKILIDKGFYSEAKTLSRKLIQKAEIKEDLEVLKAALKEYWNIHLLNGELDDDLNEGIQKQLNLTFGKEEEIINLEEIYRLVTTLYYNFFFKKRDLKYQREVSDLTKELSDSHLLSDKARHVFYEIMSIESVINSDLNKHHAIRKNQLKHLINSPVFESQNLLILMVLSNTFTLLKTKALVNELNAYLIFMEEYFKPFIDTGADSVFIEKYCDIYFSNHSFIQAWLPNEAKLNDLLGMFNSVISKGDLSSPILIRRIYLTLIELLIISENHKVTRSLFNQFFNFSKKEKYYNHYIAGDLLFIVENILEGRLDTFDHALEAFNRKLKRNELELDQDQKVLHQLLNDIFRESKKEPQFYVSKIENKQTYKLIIYMLLFKGSLTEIRKTYFPVSDSEYDATKDEYLKKLPNQSI